jgi:hypothetical protein
MATQNLQVSPAAGSVISFETVTGTAPSLQETKGQPGQVVLVSGYRIPGDGGGGQFFWSTAPETDNRGTIIVPGSTLDVFLTDACWKRIYTGAVSVGWFGARANGIDNDGDAFRMAIAASHNVYVPPGTYAVDAIESATHQTLHLDSLHLFGVTGSVSSNDPRSVLVPYNKTVGTHILNLSDDQAVRAPEMTLIENLVIDGQGVADVVGLHLYKAQNTTIRNVTVVNCRDGFVVEAQPFRRVLEVLFENCLTSRNSAYGYRIARADLTKPIGSFSCVTLLNCASEQDGTGIKISGDGLHRIQSCEVQASPRIGIEIVGGARVTIADTYVETAPGGTTLVASESITVDSRLGAKVLVLNSVVPGATIPPEDSSSTIHAIMSNINAHGPLRSASRLGRLADITSTEIVPTWGPPNTRHPGAVYPKGFEWTDKFGVEWLCTTAGTSGASRFIASRGRILRPVSLKDLTNGNLLWYPQEDMVITRLSLMITEPFVHDPNQEPKDFSLGTLRKPVGLVNSVGDDLIMVTDFAQLAIQGTVLVSTTNPKPYALLAPAGREAFMRGTAPDTSPPAGSRIAIFTHPTSTAAPLWTAGAGVLVVEGYYLKYD